MAQNGGLSSILTSITKVDPLTLLLSLQIIAKMSSIQQCHYSIMENASTVSYLTSIAAGTQDLQVACCALFTFVYVYFDWQQSFKSKWLSHHSVHKFLKYSQLWAGSLL